MGENIRRRVFFSSLAIVMAGIQPSFQLAAKAKMAWVAMAGFMRGRMIWLNIRNSPAPSILADWIISLERDAYRYMHMKKTVMGDAMEGR